MACQTQSHSFRAGLAAPAQNPWQCQPSNASVFSNGERIGVAALFLDVVKPRITPIAPDSFPNQLFKPRISVDWRVRDFKMLPYRANARCSSNDEAALDRLGKHTVCALLFALGGLAHTANLLEQVAIERHIS